MILINGQARDCIAVSDRGLQYGDGVFETITVIDGEPRFWDEHVGRLARGCERLRMPCPDLQLLTGEAKEVCAGAGKAVLKVIVTRGGGGRGYRPPQPAEPTRIVSLHDWPDYPQRYYREGIRVRVCATRWSANPALAGIKHLNRLEQVLARAEWDDADIGEGLMLDGNERVISGTMTNLFLVAEGRLITPDLSDCGIEGITRARVLQWAAQNGVDCAIGAVSLPQVLAADEVFACNSIAGIWPVRAVEEHGYSIGPVSRAIMAALSSASNVS